MVCEITYSESKYFWMKGQTVFIMLNINKITYTKLQKKLSLIGWDGFYNLD